MLVKPLLSNQHIIDSLNTYYDIDVVALTLLPLGADTNASVFKAEARDSSSYFVKLKRGHHHNIGFDIVELLHHAGIQQIIPPVKTVHHQLTQLIDDITLIVYPFIDGHDGFSCALTDEQWITLGKTLRRIHDIDIPTSLQHQIRQEAYSPKWREIVRLLYSKIEVETFADEVARKLWRFMQENKLIIHRLVNRADELAQILQNETPKLVLCHSDIHAGNVLIDANQNFYIVDWDDPILAPKERDLMFIGGGVANVWNKPHEETLFYQGYGHTEINQKILAYYRHERIVEDIAIYGQEILLTESDDETRQETYQHFIDMFEPNGVVDIAFKTDGH